MNSFHLFASGSGVQAVLSRRQMRKYRKTSNFQKARTDICCEMLGDDGRLPGSCEILPIVLHGFHDACCVLLVVLEA